MTKALYFKSMNRTFYILGIQRQLFFLLLGLCGPLAYSGYFKIWADIVAILVFSVGYLAAVMITRADAQLLQIYIRHIKYRNYYSPYSGIHSVIRLIKSSVPVYQGNL